MSNPLEAFVTITHQDFNWPYPKPIITKPAQPPMNTGTRLYATRTDPEDCKCDAHGHQSNKNRYKSLAEKERRLYDELKSLNHEATNLTSVMLDSSCEPIDETMKSVYRTDYKKRGLPIDDYRQLIVAVDSPIGSPIKADVSELKNGYRDPTRFRFSAIGRPNIEPAKPIHLATFPEAFSLWDQPFSGRSEYVDTISKMGLSNMKNRQQYREPLPSSRRRFGDCKL